MENCTEDDDMQNGTVLFQLTVYIPMLSMGTPLNVIAFWVFCCKLKRWTEIRVYMINFIVTDSCTVFALPFLMYFTRYEHPIHYLGFTIQNICFTNMPKSILIITLLTTDLYIAINFPLKAKILQSPPRSASICVVLWIILMIYSYFHLQFHDKKEKFCFWKQSAQPSYSLLVSVIFGYFTPLVIVTFCSVEVPICLKKMTVRSSHETTLTQKAIRMISVNLCVLIVCFSHFNIALLSGFAVGVAGACSLLLEVRACVLAYKKNRNSE